jgi:hypothetical protein
LDWQSNRDFAPLFLPDRNDLNRNLNCWQESRGQRLEKGRQLGHNRKPLESTLVRKRMNGTSHAVRLLFSHAQSKVICWGLGKLRD